MAQKSDREKGEGRETDRQADRQADRQTGRQADRQTDRQRTELWNTDQWVKKTC